MKQKIKEILLHYVWRTKNFDVSRLHTTDGREIVIHHFGNYNTDAGPDFLNASITIDGTKWAGQVEMHTNSSDWHTHQHSSDPAYDNVILHVVYHDDQPVLRQNKEAIPTLELYDKISPTIINKYFYLHNTSTWIPCQDLIDDVPHITKSMLLSRLVAERLEAKSIELQKLLQQNDLDLLQTTYARLAWCFGLSVNADAMLHLTQRLALKIMSKHRDHLIQLEALLFGTAGLLQETNYEHPYIEEMKREYSFLRTKYNLTPMRAVEWKMMRMRPSSFPTIRLAQFARLLHRSIKIDHILEMDINELSALFSISLDSGYWYNHYTLTESSVARKKSIGTSKFQSIIINAIAPLLFTKGILRIDQKLRDRAVQLLENLSAEKNTVIKKWSDLGFQAHNAADTQGLLQLKKHYCDQFQCLNCSIGHALMSPP